ncbi:hypothetical protein TNCV_650071 [Trichonephila clavipes]|nr:hypothetical protein TNCV_650071 [Trichonephila clavipes]
MSLDLSSMSFDLSNMSWDLSSMSWDLSSMSFDLSNMSWDLSSMSFVDDPLSQSRCFKQESRPETQRWGRKTGEKRHDSYKKNRGNVPLGSEKQGVDKKEGDKSHVKGAVENEKGGDKKTGSIQRRSFEKKKGARCSMMSQGSSESVQEFAARINKLGTQIFQSGNSAQNTAVRNANDQLLQSRFISGLRNDFRRFVLSRDPLNLDESINAALIEEQNMKLNQIANDERSGLSPAQAENLVLSALTDRLEEINLRVGRLQEASSVTARKTGGNSFNRRENAFKCFYCGIQGHRQAECRKKQRDIRSASYQPPRRSALAIFLFHVTPASMGGMSISKNRLFVIITQPPRIRLADFVGDVEPPIKLQASRTSRGLLDKTTGITDEPRTS